MRDGLIWLERARHKLKFTCPVLRRERGTRSGGQNPLTLNPNPNPNPVSLEREKSTSAVATTRWHFVVTAASRAGETNFDGQAPTEATEVPVL